MLYKGTIIKSHKKDISHSIYNYPQKKDYNSHSGILFSSHEKIHSIIFTDKDGSKKRSFVTTPYITNTTNATKGRVSSDRNTFIPTLTSLTSDTDKVSVRRDVGDVQEYFIKHTETKKIKGVLGKIYISTTKNNTIITLIDTKGNTKGWSCSGSLGFKNARKSTTYAAQAAAENIVKKAKILGYTHLRLLVKGLGRGKQSCLRALSKSGLKIISIEDKTGIPYNGCRLSKKRRV